jgi:glycosyltransferase involved in cell wall biosynthesis
MKNIAIFTPQFPVPSETFIRLEIEALKKAGHKVHVITMERISEENFDYPIYELRKSDIFKSFKTIFKLKKSDIKKAYEASSVQKSISNKSLLFYALLANHYIKENKIEHVHCHFMHNSLAYALVAAKLSGITISSVGHGHDVYVNASDLKEKIAFCNFNVAVCKNMQEKLKKINPSIIPLIHCGVNLEYFKKNELPENKQTKLLFVGRLVEKKGLKYALIAISKIKEIDRPILDIIGSGEKLNELKKLSNDLKINKNIYFLGKKTPKEIFNLSKKYDGFIAPFCIAKNGDRDTGPVVLKEAMAMGLPIITTNIMGCREIVNSRCGYIVESKNAEKLKLAISNFMSLTKNKKTKMSESARNRAKKHFDYYVQGKKLSNLIEQVK